MNTRILQIRKNLKLTQQEFATQIGISRSSLSEMELKTAPITERTIISICAKFNVNENWLRHGKGEMFNSLDKKFDEFFSIYNNLNEPLQDFLYKTALNLLDTQNRL